MEAEPSRAIPAGVTQLIGRTSDLVELGELLEGTRPFTLVGPSGVGKTAFACDLARAQKPNFANGVWVVELLSVTDPSAAIDAVATTLDVQTSRGRSLNEAVVDVWPPSTRWLCSTTSNTSSSRSRSW